MGRYKKKRSRRAHQGGERGTGPLLTLSWVSGGQPCLVPTPPSLQPPPLPLTYSAFSLLSLPPLASDFPKTLLRGRAVTITPFRSIQTCSGGEAQGEGDSMRRACSLSDWDTAHGRERGGGMRGTKITKSSGWKSTPNVITGTISKRHRFHSS